MDVKILSNYISSRYHKEFGEPIDEMKLHKLLYFSQRESLIMTYEPLFDEEFTGWCYGPVMTSIRSDYKNGNILENVDYDSKEYDSIKPVMDSIFEKYADRKSTSLSRLSHCEYSWLQSRKGLDEYENGNRKIKVSDIAIDADRIRIRRALYNRVNN